MVSQRKCRLHEFDSGDELDLAASGAILAAAEKAISERGMFRIVLAGGDTPRGVYRLLREADTNWSAWHAYFGDERCLPDDDPGRNSVMAHSALLGHVAIPAAQIRPIRGELGATAAADRYTGELAPVGEFDLVLLGLGEDGHTASLFPGREWGEAEDAPAVLAVHDAPKLPAGRVSLSARRLSRARQVIFLVTGEAKRDALVRLVKGDNIPASAIRPVSGIDIYTDLHAGTVPQP